MPETCTWYCPSTRGGMRRRRGAADGSCPTVSYTAATPTMCGSPWPSCGRCWASYSPQHEVGMIPYGRQSIEDDDIAAVVSVLRGDWLTQGPAIEAFESALCAVTGAKYAVAMASGTVVLHAALWA